MKLPILYKLSTDGVRVVQWEVEVDKNCFRTISGFVNMKLTTTEWTCCETKNEGKSNETTPEQQAIAEAEAMHRKRKEKSYFEDIKLVKGKKYFEPMLAHKWEDRKDKVTYPIYSQPKLDGIRCVAKADGLWSRNGKVIVSVPHIYEDLKPLFKNNPDLILDGELYCDKLSNDFDKICSLVKKTKPKPEDIKESKNVIEYHVYDIPSVEMKFSLRSRTLNQLTLPKSCVVVNTFHINSEDDVNLKYEEYIEQGYEGQMLRVDAPYENKRSKSLLKHKSFVDEEYQILDIFEGKGNRTGMAGYATFKTKAGKEFSSNFKFNWDKLKEIWDNKDEYVGKIATIKYFSLTKDDVPRFPYIIRFRDYE